MLLENLKPIFKNIGLTEIDLKIYLHLLKYPGQNVNQLAKAGNLTRTNCYNYIESLEKKGLIYLIPESKVNRFNATNPSQIKKLLQELVTNSKDQIKILDEIANKLESIQTKDPIPEVRYYKGKEGIEILIKEAFSNNKIDVIYNADPKNKIVFDLGKKLNKWYKSHPSTKIREIRNSQHRGTKKHVDTDKYQLRFANPTQIAYSRVLLTPHKVYLIKNTQINESQSTAIGICIEDADIYKTQQMLFNLLWDNSSE